MAAFRFVLTDGNASSGCDLLVLVAYGGIGQEQGLGPDPHKKRNFLYHSKCYISLSL